MPGNLSSAMIVVSGQCAKCVPSIWAANRLFYNRRVRCPEASRKKNESCPCSRPFWRWFWGRSFGLIGTNARLVVVTAGIRTCVWSIAEALKVYAGKQSNANIGFGFDLLADIGMVYTLSMAVGTTGVGLYLRERNLHRKTRANPKKRPRCFAHISAIRS